MKRFLIALARLSVDLLLLGLRLLCWILEHVCEWLEICSAHLRTSTLAVVSAAPVSIIETTADPEPAENVLPIRQPSPEPLRMPLRVDSEHDDSELDLLARQLWGTKGKPDKRTYELAESILNRATA